MSVAATMDRPVRICIVEDDPVLGAHLTDTLKRVNGFEIASTAASFADGLAALDGAFDVLLVDLALPDGNGLDLIARARTLRGKTVKVIVISVFGDVVNVVKAIEAGADGYLLKGSDTDQAAKAIADVLAGGAPISPAVAGHILARLRSIPAAAEAPQAQVGSLTERERDVLSDLAKGYTYKEVAKRQGISHHTVADHVKAIYRKLSVRSRGQAVFEAMQNGIIDLKD
jgi:DNA-binding NarL/FixJ family response regulator